MVVDLLQQTRALLLLYIFTGSPDMYISLTFMPVMMCMNRGIFLTHSSAAYILTVAELQAVTFWSLDIQ